MKKTAAIFATAVALGGLGRAAAADQPRGCDFPKNDPRWVFWDCAPVPSFDLSPGGLTISGPADARISASATQVLFAGISAVDACLTLANPGVAPVVLELVGGGTGTLTVPQRKVSVLCGVGVQGAAATCQAPHTGECRVRWRLDSTR